MVDSIANQIYDILMERAGASTRQYDRENFVRAVVTHQTREYRFGGRLGFGGKFWNVHGRWYVSSYPEDEMALGRRQIIEATNTALAALRERVETELPHA